MKKRKKRKPLKQTIKELEKIIDELVPLVTKSWDIYLNNKLDTLRMKKEVKEKDGFSLTEIYFLHGIKRMIGRYPIEAINYYCEQYNEIQRLNRKIYKQV